MSEFDLIIRNGTVVEATGVPAYKGDVAIKNGKIARISGKIKPNGTKELDATGCIVAPGAVEQHAHYDGQINWDPYCTLSGWHGMTSMTVGHCGYGVAPVRPEDREANMLLHSRIEAIPLHSMQKGIRWDWVTFPEYLDSLQHQGIGVNVGSQFAYSPARVWVLGAEAAGERTWVTQNEQEQLLTLYREAMDAGAFGFSANKNLVDRPADGGYLPTHVASDEEFIALAEVLGGYGIGSITWTLGVVDETGADPLIEKMARASGRPVQFAAVVHDQNNPEFYKKQLKWLQNANKAGLSIFGETSCMQIDARFTLAEFNLLDDMPHWLQALLGTPKERMARLRLPETREGMKKDIANWDETDFHKDWTKFTVLETMHERNNKYDGLSIAEIAKMEDKDPVDALLDLAMDENLETEFSILEILSGNSDAVAEILTNPFTHPSFSDGGAHVRFLTTSTWPTYLLTRWVRDEGLLSLEQAHYKMSALPAWLAGFRDRGVLREGMAGDIIVYNLEELGFEKDKPEYAFDFPGGEKRLVQKPTGMRYILINGQVTFEENKCTGALPGKVLRSYNMVG
jgi:N-acyl-D-aspartate/D-glutamate deacylase